MAYTEKRQSSRQRGFMTVMLLLLLGLFLTLTVFALDLGNLYLWQLRLDKATRAGAQAGIGFRGLTGWTASQDPAGIEDAVRSTVRDGFRAYLNANDILSNDNLIRPVYNAAADTVTVTTTFNVPTFLYGRIRNIFAYGFNAAPPPPMTINSTQTAQLNPATVAMVLDISGSMNCPAAVGTDCACRNTAAGCTEPSKLDALLNAAQAFAAFFNPNRDRIAIIPFNISANVALPFRAAGFDRDALQEAIRALDNQAASNTNPCDALAQAIGAFNDLGGAALQLQPFVVLFTDGAPNAFRGEFNTNALNPRAFATGVLPNGGAGTTQLYHYALEWVDTSDGTERFYRGPSTFIVGEDSVPRGFEVTGTTYFPIGATTCGTVTNDPNDFELLTVRGRADGQTGCFNVAANGNFPQLFIPNTQLQAFVNNVPMSRATPANWWDPDWPANLRRALGPSPRIQKYDELPYYCAIEAADWIRRNFGGTIFTVGLGPATQPINCPEPLQDADNHVARKDLFLTRLAFSRQMFLTIAENSPVDPRYVITGGQAPKNATSCPGHRYNGNNVRLSIGYTSGTLAAVGGRPNHQTLRPQRPVNLDPNQRRINTQGEYYATNDANEVSNIFGMIAKTILLRSTS